MRLVLRTSRTHVFFGFLFIFLFNLLNKKILITNTNIQKCVWLRTNWLVGFSLFLYFIFFFWLLSKKYLKSNLMKTCPQNIEPTTYIVIFIYYYYTKNIKILLIIKKRYFYSSFFKELYLNTLFFLSNNNNRFLFLGFFVLLFFCFFFFEKAKIEYRLFFDVLEMKGRIQKKGEKSFFCY